MLCGWPNKDWPNGGATCCCCCCCVRLLELAAFCPPKRLKEGAACCCCGCVAVAVVVWPNGLGFEAAGWPKNDDVPAGLPKSDIVYGAGRRNSGLERAERKGRRGRYRGEVGVRRQGKRKQRVSLDQLYHLQLSGRFAKHDFDASKLTADGREKVGFRVGAVSRRRLLLSGSQLFQGGTGRRVTLDLRSDDARTARCQKKSPSFRTSLQSPVPPYP